MADPTAAANKPKPTLLLYALGVFLIGAAAIFFYSRYQRERQTSPTENLPVAGLVRPGNPDFEYYKNKIRLTNVKAELGINFANHRIAIISGLIANEGDRKLEALELHIALFDVYDKLSKERIAAPLRPGVGINRALEPMEKRNFTVWMENIEQLWNPKRLEIEITGLKYK